MAATVIHLADLDGADGFRLDGVAALDGSGAQVSDAGDVNGDGFADVIVAARDAGDGPAPYTGESYVVFGKAGGFGAAIALAGLDGADGFRIDGVESYDYSSRSVSAAGDVNGDGFGDVIVGAPGSYPAGDHRSAGESYVIFGKAAGFGAALALADLDGADGFRIDGVDGYDGSGASVSAAGDFNGDGFGDVIVGAYQAASYAGESYILFGKAAGFDAALALTDLDGADGFRIDGIDPGDYAGAAVSAAGDVNGDGFGDVFIGAPSGDSGGGVLAGESYLVFGRAGGVGAALALASLDGADGFRLGGASSFDSSGAALHGAGDVNGDGFDDLIIGASSGDPGGNSGAGESYVVFGKAGGFDADLALADLDGADGFRIDGVDAGDSSGFSVSAAGDVNGDGFGDLIVGAPSGDPGGRSGAGESYVVFGAASGFGAAIALAALDAAQGFRLDGVDAGDASGRSVSAAGDVNGDGFDDLIVGASFGDPGGLNAAGETYVVFGFDSGAVTHAGTAAAEMLQGDIGANVIIGGLGDDVLVGGGGQDVLRGGGGDDVLAIGDMTFRHADGGLGVDTLRLAGDDLELDLTGQGNSGVNAIEAVHLAGVGAGAAIDALATRNLSETSNSLRISGEAGTFLTLRDAGWTFAADAAATRTFENGAASIVVDRIIGLDAGGDDVANLIRGIDGDDSLAGQGGDDQLFGEDGDDVLEGGLGADRLHGGDGVDIASYVGSAARVIVNLGSGYRVGGDAAGDIYDSIEGLRGSGLNDVLVGTGGDDVLLGGEGRDALRGEVGDDVLEGGTGFDTLVGGAGVDIASYAASAARVVINLGTGFRTGGDASGDTFDGVEGLRGSNFDDILVGDAGANRLLGGDGDDTLRGDTGDDLLEGGAGFDTLVGGDGVDIASYAASSARVIINLGSEFRTGGDARGDDFDGVEGLQGSGFNDVLVGDAGANRLLGGGGDDTLRGDTGDDVLEGGAGFDTLVGGDGVDIASYAASAARVVINLGSGFRTGGDARGDLFDGVEGLQGSSFDDILVGTNAADRLLGGSGQDTLRGEDGDDVLEGGAGFDTMIGGGGTDLASYASSGARVVINLGTGFRTGGDASGDAYIGIEDLEGSVFNDTLVGTNAANRLLGGAGRDVLRGEDGDDVLEGGAGFDTLVGGAGADMASYAGSAARVLVNLGANFRSGGDASGDRFLDIEGLQGSAFDDVLVGTAGANTLRGGDGDDQLRGEAGEDVLNGGGGDDVLRGGAGADLFAFGLGSGVDTIGDFAVGVDSIDISAYGFADFGAALAATTDIGGRAQIALNGAEDVLRLNGVQKSDLIGGDFIL